MGAAPAHRLKKNKLSASCKTEVFKIQQEVRWGRVCALVWARAARRASVAAQHGTRASLHERVAGSAGLPAGLQALLGVQGRRGQPVR